MHSPLTPVSLPNRLCLPLTPVPLPTPLYLPLTPVSLPTPCTCLPQNPDKKGQGPPNVPSAGLEPQYSDEQREEFGDRSWIGVEDPSLLDVAGTELLLVGAKADPITTGATGHAACCLCNHISKAVKKWEAVF